MAAFDYDHRAVLSVLCQERLKLLIHLLGFIPQWNGPRFPSHDVKIHLKDHGLVWDLLNMNGIWLKIYHIIHIIHIRMISLSLALSSVSGGTSLHLCHSSKTCRHKMPTASAPASSGAVPMGAAWICFVATQKGNLSTSKNHDVIWLHMISWICKHRIIYQHYIALPATSSFDIAFSSAGKLFHFWGRLYFYHLLSSIRASQAAGHEDPCRPCLKPARLCVPNPIGIITTPLCHPSTFWTWRRIKQPATNGTTWYNQSVILSHSVILKNSISFHPNQPCPARCPAAVPRIFLDATRCRATRSTGSPAPHGGPRGRWWRCSLHYRPGRGGGGDGGMILATSGHGPLSSMMFHDLPLKTCDFPYVKLPRGSWCLRKADGCGVDVADAQMFKRTTSSQFWIISPSRYGRHKSLWNHKEDS